MSSTKWLALLLCICVFWIDVGVGVILLTGDTVVGLILATFAVPLSIGMYKDFIDDWSKL